MDWIKQHPLATLLCLYLAGLNLYLFILYGWDKRQAKKQNSRTPEKRLHVLALLGGTAGALLGQLVFRHKTRKKRFQVVFWGTVLLQVLLFTAMLYLTWTAEG